MKHGGIRIVERHLKLNPEDHLACFYSRAGEVEKALDCLDRAARVGPLSKDYLEHDSDLDPIRREPRFQALMARL